MMLQFPRPACALLLSLVASTAFAQLDQGQISGTVKDSTDATIAGATVSARHVESGRTGTTETGQNGAYLFTNLLVGYYEISVQQTGFKRFVRQNVKVDAAARTTVDINLELGEVTETVNVESALVQIQSETAQMGRTVESRQITDLALNGRNPIFLTLLKAGVVGGNFNNFNPAGLHETFSINGGRRNGNNVTIDGVNANRTRGDWNGSAQLGVLNVDTIAEVQILTTTYPAEYGRNMDGQIRFVTKSGTRNLHGTAWWFHRNALFDANSWIRNNSPNFSESSRPAPFRFNQPGYAIGGPVTIGNFNRSRDRLFFFVSQEWMAFRREQTQTATVPSELMRRGDFSELLSPANTYFRRQRIVNDPLAGGTPFAGNVIPASRLSSNGIGILRSYPLPTAGFLQGTDNWIKTRPNPRDSRKDTFRIDYYATAKHRFNFVGQMFSYKEDAPFLSGLDRSNSRWDRPNMTASLSATSTWTSRLITDFTFTAANDIVRIGIFDQDGEPLYIRDRYNINFPYVIPGRKNIPNRIPTANIVGFTTVDGSTRPVSSSGPMFLWSGNLTYVAGSAHTLKFGGWFGHDQQNNNDQVGLQNGTFRFLDLGNPLTSGVAIANTALGNFDAYDEVGPAAYTLLRSNTMEFYGQDTWKVSPKLTIEGGVRWSWHQPWYAKWNDIANFDARFYDPARRATVHPTLGFITGGDPYNGVVLPGNAFPDSARGRANGATLPNVDRLFRGQPRGFVDTYRNAFAPRLGIAYRPLDRTVLRAGFGIFHQRQMHNQGSLFRNAPNQIAVTVNNGDVDRPGGAGVQTFPFYIRAIELNAKYPTAYSWSFSVQRELPASMVLELAYVGKAGINQERIRNYNQLLANTVWRNPTTQQNAMRPWHGLGRIDMTSRDGRTSYNAFQLSLDRRFSRGLGMGLSYTFSKSLNNIMTPFDAYSWVRARDSDDRPHLLNLNFIYELPLMRNSTGWRKAALGGWQVSGVVFARSGSLFSVTDPNDLAGVGVGSADQPWDVSGSLAVSERGLGLPWFNRAAFTAPARGTFGSAGLNIIRGPLFQNWDAALFKEWVVKERFRPQFRFEVFNFPNLPLLGNPGVNPRAGNFGLITQKTGERNVQLGLKLYF